MQVALDGADDSGALGLDAGRNQVGLQDGDAGVHGAGGNEDLRDENFIVFELFADDVHTGEQALVEDLCGLDALVDRLLDQLLDLGGASLLQEAADFFENCHSKFLQLKSY